MVLLDYTGRLKLQCNNDSEIKVALQIQGLTRSKKYEGLFSAPPEILVVHDLSNYFTSNKIKLEFTEELIKWGKYTEDKYADSIQQQTVKKEVNTTFPLRDYQKEAINWISKTDACILGDEPGLGKTAASLFGSADCDKVLITCPAYVASHWERHIEDLLGEKVTDGFSDKNTNKRLERITESNYKYVIVNHELLRSNTAINILSRKNFSAFIIDEAHKFQGRNTQQSDGASSLSQTIKKNILLTGSVIWNTPASVWKLLNIIDSVRFSSYWGFVERFCLTEDSPWGTTVGDIKPSMVDTFKWVLSPYLLRRKKVDVAKDLPPKVYSVVNYTVDVKKYNSIKKDDTLTPMRKVISLRDSCNCKQKAATLLNILEDNKGQQIVIFAWYHNTIKHLQEVLAKSKIDFLTVSGKQDPTDRVVILDRFRNKETDILIAGIGSITYGVDLDNATVGIFYEMDWVPTNNAQAEDRLHRIKSKKSVNIINIIGKGTIEEHIYDINKEKINVTEELIIINEVIKRMHL